jgi:Ca2+-binding EF-hand superfamily protein
MNGLGPISINGANVFGSSQEMRDRLTEKVDTDQNGRVSFEEIAATERGAPVADRLRAFDADGSGDLSTEELSQIQQHVAEKVRDKVQEAAFSGAAPQAMFDALFAEKED